ncbi:hypothetical protein BO94DRAFT_571461 [Aspergillus sclerotioniger CBS 115572]|uniref:GPI-anchored cell wall organization protein Ecm33 n=1 Tax=Aspergillus sclerotioniger CBS 115572 TaxID=1450535 RepID=A0A317XCV8_9EURO|nr:hypothetical protein BO94DRAFT_571461 [Aspergillus sclerotioniger CBS 115572]PWY95961.1 hypothetical protein BO94DRAFT_571461 [Aspergillus sclerotioniger CBS 115572]
MKLRLLGLGVVVVGLRGISVVSAQDCYANTTYGDFYVDVKNFYTQDELDAYTTNCTTLHGDIGFGTNFTGSAVVNNLINITGVVTVGSNLTAIEFPDLLSLGSVDVDSDKLRSISMPKLESVASFNIDNAEELRFSSPRVAKADYIWITGELDSLDLPKLETVTRVLEICSDSDCTTPPGTAFDVILPALRNASEVKIAGNLSSLSLPVLATTGCGGQYAGVYVSNNGHPLNMSFPELTNVTESLKLKGAMSGVNLPSLRNTTADITIDSSTKLDVDLSSLVETSKIFLKGKISSANFASLKVFTEVEIESTVRIDCRTSLPQNITSTELTVCSSTAVSKSSGISGRSIKIGVGVGVGVGGAIGLLIIVIWMYRRDLKRKKRASQAVATLDVYGLQEGVGVDRADTAPPPYSRY